MPLRLKGDDEADADADADQIDLLLHPLLFLFQCEFLMMARLSVVCVHEPRLQRKVSVLLHNAPNSGAAQAIVVKRLTHWYDTPD